MNYRTTVSAKDTIPCSQEDFDALLQQISVEQLENETEGKDDIGWPGLSYHNGHLFIYGDSEDETGFAGGEVSDVLLKMIGKIIEKAGLLFMEFGVAYHGDKIVVNSCGGKYFRIYPDGSEVYQLEGMYTLPDSATLADCNDLLDVMASILTDTRRKLRILRNAPPQVD